MENDVECVNMNGLIVSEIYDVCDEGFVRWSLVVRELCDAD